jgi:nucleoside-diphosphate-sugar epimerase
MRHAGVDAAAHAESALTMARDLVLVTGGSGFLGINLIRLLLASGFPVRSLDIAPFDYPEQGRIDAVSGDIRDAAAVERAMTGASIVVHAAAALPLAPADDILSTGITGTRLLLEAAEREGVSRFIFISSTAVYGVPDHHPIREDDPLHGVGPYGESKIAAERLCMQARSGGRCVTVLRPKTFVGPERLGAFELLYDWAWHGRAFPVLGRGDNPYQLLDVEDLCHVIHRCMTLEVERVSDTFNVGAAEFGTMRENFQAVLDRAGHGRRVVSLPAAPAIALLRVLAALRLSPLYPWIYETANRESAVAIDRMQARLGYTPGISNRQALVRNYDWYVAHRSAFAGRRGVSHRVPWKRGFLRVAERLF